MKIISGGQTGADLGGLEGALKAGILTGGMAPAGYRTEKGPNLELRDKYHLIESESSGYHERTINNIRNSHGTVIFAGKIDSGGTQLTINKCVEMRRPYICNPKPEELTGFIRHNFIEILNVAGNRESVSPGIQKKARDTIAKAIYDLQHNVQYEYDPDGE